MLAFRHAGDLGDILYSLPVVRFLTGDKPSLFMIESVAYTRQPLVPGNWCGIDNLLRMQPYIVDVVPWDGRRVDVNLNDFRAALTRALRIGQGKDRHLAHWMCETHGVPVSAIEDRWLQVDQPVTAARVVFSRAGAGRPPHQVYRNPLFPWHDVWDRYHKDAVFVGTALEHETFCLAWGKVPHYPTADLADAARVIAGCELFVGNQTATHAIAEGLKKNIVLEVWREGPNCIVHRPGVVHGWDQYVKLPDL